MFSRIISTKNELKVHMIFSESHRHLQTWLMAQETAKFETQLMPS